MPTDTRFTWDAPTAPLVPPPQLVNRERDAAMQRVLAHAEAARQDFARQARRYIVQYLAVHGPTAGEGLTAACKAVGIVAHDDRAMGPIFMQLARQGVIEKCGTVRRERGHGASGGNLWRLRSDTALDLPGAAATKG